MTVIYDELTDFSVKTTVLNRDARELISALCDEPYDEVDDFVKDMVFESLSHYGVIRDAYIPYLKNWSWDRLPLLTQAILLMSYTHFHYVEKSDKRIVINIAVTLAKKYTDAKQAQFINAILDGVLQS